MHRRTEYHLLELLLIVANRDFLTTEETMQAVNSAEDWIGKLKAMPEVLRPKEGADLEALVDAITEENRHKETGGMRVQVQPDVREISMVELSDRIPERPFGRMIQPGEITAGDDRPPPEEATARFKAKARMIVGEYAMSNFGVTLEALTDTGELQVKDRTYEDALRDVISQINALRPKAVLRNLVPDEADLPDPPEPPADWPSSKSGDIPAAKISDIVVTPELAGKLNLPKNPTRDIQLNDYSVVLRRRDEGKLVGIETVTKHGTLTRSDFEFVVSSARELMGWY